MLTRFRAALTAAVAVFALAGAANAQEQWKLGSLGAPGSAMATMGDMVAGAVTKAGGGDYSVEFQFVGNEQEMVQQVLRGRLQMGATSPQGLGVAVPDGTVLAFPFLWDSDAQRDYVIENNVKPLLDELLAAKGLKLLAIGDAGYYGVFCKFDCQDPATLSGVKVRVSPTPAAKLFWDTIGAVPVQLPLSDLWPGLEQNLVSAADIPLPYYLTTPARESAPFFVKTDHFHAPWIFFMNKALWDGLSADKQQAITAGVPSTAELNAVFTAAMTAAETSFASSGGHYLKLDADLAAKWRKGIVERLPELLSSMGPDAHKLYDAIEAGKADFAKK